MGAESGRGHCCHHSGKSFLKKGALLKMVSTSQGGQLFMGYLCTVWLKLVTYVCRQYSSEVTVRSRFSSANFKMLVDTLSTVNV